MQSLLHFFGVAFVVQLEQAGEDFTAGGFADRLAVALLRLVEPVAEIAPAVCVNCHSSRFIPRRHISQSKTLPLLMSEGLRAREFDSHSQIDSIRSVLGLAAPIGQVARL
jgi:hypothetical protein